MLPSLLGRATDDGTADLTIPEFIQTELAAIIRGAALAVEPGEEGHWGVTLAAERVRQRDGRGHMTFGTCRVKASNVAEFGDRIIEEAQETDWGKDCFFFFKTRGIRGSTTHTKAEQQEALSTLLDQFDLTHFKPKDWFIDVGAEIQSQGDVLWWRRDALWRVVATALAVGEAEAADIVSKARMDAPCQLEDIHGCRIEPSQADARGNNCSYLQMYCTEKHITYQLSSDSNSHQLKASAVVKDYRAAQRFAEAMAICYQDAAKGFDGYARVELRLPLEKALVDILPRDLERVVVAIPRAAWWSVNTMPQ